MGTRTFFAALIGLGWPFALCRLRPVQKSGAMPYARSELSIKERFFPFVRGIPLWKSRHLLAKFRLGLTQVRRAL